MWNSWYQHIYRLTLLPVLWIISNGKSSLLGTKSGKVVTEIFNEEQFAPKKVFFSKVNGDESLSEVYQSEVFCFQSVTGEDVTQEELGGAKTHTSVSG